MTQFEYEKLHVYRAGLDFVVFVSRLAKTLKGDHRHAKDQLLRSSQSVPLNIAEGNGKRSLRDRQRYLEIACGSAMESAATLDVLVCSAACTIEDVEPGKKLLIRIVSMLTKMTEKDAVTVREDPAQYDGSVPLEYEYEYENEYDRPL